jgi:hypothetical protein
MESQTTIIPLELSDGTIVRVEATPIGEQQVAFQPRPFKEATDAIKAVAKELGEGASHFGRYTRTGKIR